jgi:hypothetical protein
MGNAPGGIPGSDGMAGAFILLGGIGAVIAVGLLFAFVCMAMRQR